MQTRWAIGVACGLAMATASRDSQAGDAGYGAVAIGAGVVFLGPIVVLDVVALGMDLGTAGPTGRPLSRAWANTELVLGITQSIGGSILVGVAAGDGAWRPAGFFVGVPVAALGFWFLGHSIWSLRQPLPKPDGSNDVARAIGFTTRTPTWNTALERTAPPSSPFVVPFYSGSF